VVVHRLGDKALGQAGFRALVFAGQADSDIEKRCFDLVAVGGEVIDEFTGRDKADREGKPRAAMAPDNEKTRLMV
jgi:hypothetical protein